MLTLALVSPALGEDLVGTVADRDGRAVAGAKVVVHGADGAASGAATTDARGQYVISGLAPGQYFITLDAADGGMQSQTVASYLGATGLTVNWSLSSAASPLASAQPGIQLTSAASINAGPAVMSAKADPPPGCKGKPGPPCGPKKSPRRGND